MISAFPMIYDTFHYSMVTWRPSLVKWLSKVGILDNRNWNFPLNIYFSLTIPRESSLLLVFAYHWALFTEFFLNFRWFLDSSSWCLTPYFSQFSSVSILFRLWCMLETNLGYRLPGILELENCRGTVASSIYMIRKQSSRIYSISCLKGSAS